MLKFDSSCLFLTKFLKTPSAAGLLHIFPKQTKRTEKGLVSDDEEVEEAIDEDEEAFIMMGLILDSGEVKLGI